MGFGSDAWDRLFGPPRPAELHPFREIRAGRATRSPRPAICSSTSAPRAWTCASSWRRRSWRGSATRCRPWTRSHGFQYFDDRDLLGFVDGTENPTDQAAIDATIIGDEDAGFAGGSYVIVQKYLHDLRGLERAADRGAGTHHRPDEAVRHRAGRRRQADLRAQRADDDRGRRHGARDRPRQHAVRRCRAGRVRHLFHRLRPLAPDRSSRC